MPRSQRKVSLVNWAGLLLALRRPTTRLLSRRSAERPETSKVVVRRRPVVELLSLSRRLARPTPSAARSWRVALTEPAGKVMEPSERLLVFGFWPT